MTSLFRRLFWTLLLLFVLAGGLAVATVYAFQTPWGADRIAAILRGWGYPVDRFRIDDIGWDRLVVDDIVVDGGALSLDRLEIGLQGSWLEMSGGLSGPGPVTLDRVAVTGLRGRAEIRSDGTVRIPALDAFAGNSSDREGRTGLPVEVDDLAISDARLALASTFGDIALTMDGSGIVRPDTLRLRVDGQASLREPANDEGVGGELGRGQFEVAVDRARDGAYIVDIASEGIDSSGFGPLPGLSGGSLWVSLETAPDFAVSRFAFRVEGEIDTPSDDSGPVSGRVTGDVGRQGMRGRLDIAIGTLNGDDGRPGWLTVEGRTNLDTVRRHLPPGLLSAAMSPPGSDLSESGAPADGVIELAVDGALADWPRARRALLALAPELAVPEAAAVAADVTAAVRTDLMLRGDRVAAAFNTLSAGYDRPAVIVAAIADAVIGGMIGVDVGRNRPLALSEAGGALEPSHFRGAFRLHNADGGMALAVVEPALIRGVAGGSPFQARFRRATTLSIRPDNDNDTDDDSGASSPDPGRFAINGDLSLDLDLAEASIDSGEDGIAFSLSMPDIGDGIDLFERGTYSLLAPSLVVDIAPLIEATTGALGLELEPVSIAVGGQGRLDQPSARATIRSSAAVDRSDMMAGALAEATVEIEADPATGTVYIRQDGCATVSIVDMAIPDGLRLAAPLELCLDLDSDGDRLTFRPASGYWPREALQFRVGEGEIDLTGWGRDADRAVISWPSLSMAFLRGDTGSDTVGPAGENPGNAEEVSGGPPMFRADLGDATVDLGSALGVIDGVALSLRASGEIVDATVSGSWMTGMLGPRQRYTLQSDLSSVDGGRGDVRVAGPGGIPVVTASGRYEAATGRVIADWRLQPIDLSTVPDPSALVPALGAVAVSEQRGTVSARGQVVWDGTLGASGVLDVADLGFATPFGSISGLSTSLRADRILPMPLSIPAGQSVSVDSVDLGFVLENGAFGFGLAGDTIRIDDLRFAWAGGTVSARPIATRLGDSERVVVLDVDGVDLAELLDDVPTEGLSITGSVSGRIPLRLTNDTVYIDDGILISDGPGRLSYDGDAETIPGAADAPSDADGGGMDILFQALENFRYERLTMTLDGQTGYNLELGLTIEGANPDLYDGYPVKLNVGVSGALDEMLRQGLETTRIGQEAEDLLREFDGELDDDELLRRLRDLER